MPIAGRDLRKERRSAEVTTVDLAAQMGISRQTLWVIEQAGAVELDRVNQYLSALKTLRDAKPEGTAA